MGETGTGRVDGRHGRVAGARWLAPVAGLTLLALPLPAHGDVLEVSGDGWHWVATGDRPAPPSEPSASVSSAAPAPATAAPVPERWRGLVAHLAETYDLSPAIIEALVWQESRWNPRAVSPVGARGLAQLMPATARALGADANDPAANIEAGTRYLRALLDGFGGNVEKALAAYNAGPGRVARANGVPHIAETQAYVRAIFARLAQQERAAWQVSDAKQER